MSFGYNSFGQLGQNHRNPDQIPKIIQSLKNENIFINKIKCGGWHNVLLNDKGNIYCFGRNNYGQCGNDNLISNNNNVLRPELNHHLVDIIIIDTKCG